MDGEEVLCLLLHGDADPQEMLEPLTYEQAMASPQAVDWKEAMNAEYAALQGHKTWDLVECPPGVSPLDGKWVYKIKRNATGQIEKFKCRFVAKGFKQIYGVEYLEVTAPVARLTSVRTILAMAAANGWEVLYMDTDTASYRKY